MVTLQEDSFYGGVSVYGKAAAATTTAAAATTTATTIRLRQKPTQKG